MFDKKLILDYLYKYGSINGKTCSSKLNISLRTLQRYIKDLNAQYPNIIRAEHSGYSLDTEQYKKLFIEKFESTETRIQSILYKIISSDKNASIDDIMNQFYISESTLRKYLQDIKIILSKYNLTLALRD